MRLANADRADHEQPATVNQQEVIQDNLGFAFGNPLRFRFAGVVVGQRAMLISRRNSSALIEALLLARTLASASSGAFSRDYLHPGAEAVRADVCRRQRRLG